MTSAALFSRGLRDDMGRRHRRTHRFAFVAKALAVGWALLVLFGRLPDRFLLHPSTHPVDAAGAVPRFVSVDGR
ncbi:MAG TPA: hypothetical protein VK324_04290 [Tepidisphaeraceae bacterium]|nr:hypothetical protein [Tepidisphaeraceae bacterium]